MPAEGRDTLFGVVEDSGRNRCVPVLEGDWKNVAAAQ